MGKFSIQSGGLDLLVQNQLGQLIEKCFQTFALPPFFYQHSKLVTVKMNAEGFYVTVFEDLIYVNIFYKESNPKCTIETASKDV